MARIFIAGGLLVLALSLAFGSSALAQEIEGRVYRDNHNFFYEEGVDIPEVGMPVLVPAVAS